MCVSLWVSLCGLGIITSKIMFASRGDEPRCCRWLPGLPDPSPAKCWEWAAATALAQTLNQQYVVTNQTSVQMWTPIYSWYSYLNYPGKGTSFVNPIFTLPPYRTRAPS